MVLEVIKALQGDLRHVVITEYVRGGNYYRAQLVIDSANGEHTVTSRPSDALCCAVYARKDILIAVAALRNGDVGSEWGTA
jgi:bifunctional DNase/RNase